MRQPENEKQLKAIKHLITQDTPKHLISNLTEIFVAYNGSELSDCATERQSKSMTFLLLLEFLSTLSNLKNEN